MKKAQKMEKIPTKCIPFQEQPESQKVAYETQLEKT
jgi:hypothetical protein